MKNSLFTPAKLLVFALTISFFFGSCSDDGSSSDNRSAPAVTSMPGVVSKTTIASALNYNKNPADELDYLVFDVKEFYMYTNFEQIPAGQHLYQYTFWQKGQPYTYRTDEEATEETPVEEYEEMEGEAPEEAAEEAAFNEEQNIPVAYASVSSSLPNDLLAQNEEGTEQRRKYASGTFGFNTQGSTSFGVYHQFVTSEVLAYGPGEYIFDVYLDSKLIERKTIKVLSDEEKASGEYTPYWLHSTIYPTFERSKEEETGNKKEWTISYFHYVKDPIVQVIPIEYNGFNRFFITVKQNGRYVLYEATKKGDKEMHQLSGKYLTDVRYFTGIDNDILYFYNKSGLDNIQLNLSSGEVSKAEKIPFAIPKTGEFPTKGGGKSAYRTSSGNTGIGDKIVHRYKDASEMGWLSWNNTSSKFYFDAGGIYEYDITTDKLTQILYDKNAASPAYFSNNGIDFIAYASESHLMIASNEGMNVKGAYFGSEFNYDNTVEFAGKPANLGDTLKVDYYAEPKLIFDHSASMEMEGFSIFMESVGAVTNSSWPNAELIRIQLTNDSEYKGSMPPYVDDYFAYAVANDQSFALLNNLLPNNKGHIKVSDARIISISDPGYGLTKNGYFDQFEFLGMDTGAIIEELQVSKKLVTPTTTLKLLATTSNTTEKGKDLVFYDSATTAFGKIAVMRPDVKDDGSFHIKRPDGSELIYEYDMNGALDVDMGWSISDYAPYTDRTCDGAANDLACIMTIDSTELELEGNYAGHQVFTLKNKDHELNKKIYDQYVEQVKPMQEYSDVTILSFDEFTKRAPFFFWKDKEDRYVRFKRTEFMTPLMCEPILYVYPTKEQMVEISLDQKVDVFASAPKASAENRWQFHAYENGQLEDLNSPAKDHRIFWEGQSLMLPKLEKGFVIQRENIASFLDEKLAFLGLNPMETEEFKEAWMEELTEKEYCFIGFYDRKIIDAAAPMNISPQPDEVIRILMDYRTLDAFEQVEAPVLEQAPAREGYTVVEWGGLKR